MAHKIKLLLILHYSPPIHGASKVGDTILRSKLLKSNFDTKFIKIKSSENLESIGKFNFKKTIDTLGLFFKISFQLISFRPQKIYFTASPQGFAFYRDLFIVFPIKVYSVIKKCEVFYHYHAKGIKEFTSKSRLNKKLTNFFVWNTNLIFISKMVLDELTGITTYKKKVLLKNGVENTISEDIFNTILENRFKTENINVLYLSNMMKDKGYDTVLDLANKIKESNITFNFAGGWESKEDKEYFNTFVNKNNLQNKVNYHGLVVGEKKQKLFEEATIFTFPSRYPKEVFPLSLLEGLSYGLPILAFDVGAVSEIVTKEVGIISCKDGVLNSFIEMQNQYLNKDVSLACRNRFLENYTTEVFERNLVAILKLKDECRNK